MRFKGRCGMIHDNDKAAKGLSLCVYRKMLDKLISCEYAPGSQINEMQLAEEYNVSRTPIREAVNRLESQGYLKVLPKKGIYVNDITIQDVLQVFQARIDMEPIALRMSAPYLEIARLIDLKQRYLNSRDSSADYLVHYCLDMEMHHYFVDHCGNRYVIEMMNRVLNDNLRITIASKQDFNLIHDAIQEHVDILDCLIRQEPIEKAMALLEKHLRVCCLVALERNYLVNKEGKDQDIHI